MKVLFAGPTLHGRIAGGRLDADPDIAVRPPAAQGDILRALRDGATAIGLVDGRFEDVPAPWHKEILYVLAEGVPVLGAASMGALRAAECAAFGMVPIGDIALRYVSGALTSDGAVAQSHGPAELDFLPLSEALVNVEATLEAAVAAEAVTPDEGLRLEVAARRIFFKLRTLDAIVAEARLAQADRIAAALRRHFVDAKRRDALLLVEALRGLSPQRAEPPAWTLQQPRVFREFLARLDASKGQPDASAFERPDDGV